MAQNITLMGASYSDVPSVLLPKTGGGTARFDDASVTTATDSDVASGKIFLASNGTITTGTNSGGGGASNVVTGTFKGTTTGAAMAVTIPYTGTGYPIALTIYPTGGAYKNGSTYYSAIQNRAIGTYFFVKANTGSAPTYSGDSEANWTSLCVVYKNSDTDATNYTNTRSMNYQTFRLFAATAGPSDSVRFSSSKNMSVYIASTSYGFMANVEYTYQITYSS